MRSMVRPKGDTDNRLKEFGCLPDDLIPVPYTSYNSMSRFAV